jgi:SAM-dependent methyltransferase
LLEKDAPMDIEQIRAWAEAAERTHLADSAAIEAWHILGAQCRFIKTLPAAASVLDVGAGDGSLQIYRTWPPPPRPDLTMFAFAIERGDMFDRYDGYELGSWPDVKPDFGGRQFDAVFAANFIEHIDQPIEFIRWAVNRLTLRGRIFLEWPRSESLTLPTAPELHVVGLDVMTGNYLDDATHRHEPPSARAVHGALTAAGLRIESAGITRVPFLEDHLLAIGKSADDKVSRTLAYWSFTSWCQYTVAQRVGTPFGQRP